MLFHYRDRIDVIVSILHITNGNELRQVDILKRANIPYNLFKECLSSLYLSGLIEIWDIHAPRTYRTTARGIHFLNICDKMRAFCGISPSGNKPNNMELTTSRTKLAPGLTVYFWELPTASKA